MASFENLSYLDEPLYNFSNEWMSSCVIHTINELTRDSAFVKAVIIYSMWSEKILLETYSAHYLTQSLLAAIFQRG